MKLLEALAMVKRVVFSTISQKKTSHCWEAFWSGLRDSNPRPSPWQGKARILRPFRKWRIPCKIGLFGDDPEEPNSLFYPPLSPCRVHFRVHPSIKPGALGGAIRRCSTDRLSNSRVVIPFSSRQAAAPATRAGWEYLPRSGSHGARRCSIPSRLPFLSASAIGERQS